MLEAFAVIVILIEAITIGALIAYVKKLRKRPDFAVFQSLQKEATKAKKDYEAIQKAFDSYRTRRDILIISSKDPIDVDAVTVMTVDAIENGAGVYGTATNVEALISAAYGLEAEDKTPTHIKHILYGNKTQLALYTGKLPKELQKIVDGDR